MGTPLLWIIFNAFVLAAIAVDLGVLHRKPHKIGLREAAVSSLVWVLLSVALGLAILHYGGHHRGLQFFTGYLIEKALSVDNLFLFLVIFRTFAIDEKLQHRVLEWGILGALVARGVMIGVGGELVERFAWVVYVFGAFLLYAAIHMLPAKKEKIHPEENPIFRFANRHLRVTREYHGERFFVSSEKTLCATPLFLVLLLIEMTDVTLAIDSVPAVFGVTRDPFLVYTSNVMAILGLRSMYFLLAGVLNRLRFLTVGLSFVLFFIGAKMIVDPWIDVPEQVSLIIVGGMLLVALLASLIFPVKAQEKTNG
jgi:tellurite resistance protein TerC